MKEKGFAASEPDALAEPASSSAAPAKSLDAFDRSNGFSFAHLIDTPIWVYDIDKARVVHANPSALNLWNAASEAELRARDFGSDMSGTVRDRLKQFQRIFTEQSASLTEAWTLYPGGVPTTRMVHFSGFPLPDGRMAMICLSPSALKYEPDNLRSAEALLYTSVMICLYSAEGPPLYLNPAARAALPQDHAEFRDLFVHASDYDDVLHFAIERGDWRQISETRSVNGTIWQDINVKTCVDAATGQPALLVTAFDVSDLKQARDKARFLANRDQLTGSFNRTYFNQMLDRLSAMPGEGRNGILYCDLDGFKQINDTFGHEAGDTVLKDVAARMQALIGNDEILARLGGDEFVLLLENTVTEEDLAARAASIVDALQAPVQSGETQLNVGISVGGALVPRGCTDWEDALHRADIALYSAKADGRNRAVIFNAEMGAKVSDRRAIESDLRSAIDNGDFALHMQPRMSLTDRRVVAAEALARWPHPTRGMVSPGEFIPICEETGLIRDLGHFVLERAADHLIEWSRQGFDIGVSVNVSAKQFLDEDLIDRFRALTAKPGFPARAMEIEITESVLIGDHDMTARRLDQISDLGFRIAIDDFGTGYSNLASISRLPLDCLKIDKSFVDQLPGSMPIMRVVQALASQLGAITVAEGVETAEQLERVHELECNQVQGFLFSRPVPAEDLASAITQSNKKLPKLLG